MRVHSLTVTAFGPFAETVEVDLDALSQDGLFLLCGPTGAGKTSLLDAIAFALYGRVPGARGQEKRLRSDHAVPAVRTEVVCELTLRGERVRITRRPEQVRPKERGGGTTKDQALLHVQRRVAGDWEPFSTRLDEGGDYLRERVGLSAEQFWQVVLLPQGEFAEFLRAEPEQRAKVLETLFDARRFTDVEDWLGEHARTARAAWTHAQDTVDRLLHRVEQSARGLPTSGSADEIPTIPAMPASEDAEHIQTYLTRQLARSSAVLAVAGAADEATKAALVAAETGCERARRAVRAADRLLAVCGQRDFLRDRAEHLSRDRNQLAAAIAAEPVRSFLEIDAAATARAQETATALRDAYAALGELDVDAQCPVGLHSGETETDRLELIGGSGHRPIAPELRRWSRSVRDEIARLAALEPELARVEADEVSLRQLVEQQRVRQASLDELLSLSQQLPAAMSEVESKRDAARLSAAGQQAAAAAMTAARARVQAATRAAELTKLVGAAQSEYAEAQGLALEAKAQWLALRETRLAGIAAELAVALADGQPCPVCGSAEHPSPAAHAVSAVNAADEQMSAERYEVLEQDSQLAATVVNDLRRELDACVSVTCGATVPAVRRELSVALAAEAATRAAAEQLPDLVAEYADLVAGRAEVASQIVELKEAQAGDRATVKGLSAAVRAGRRRLDRAQGEDPSLAARRGRLSALADAADAVQEAAAAHASAAAAAESTREDLADRLLHCDISSAYEARAGLLDQQRRDQLAAAIREYEDSQTGAAAELTSATGEFGGALTELAEVDGLEGATELTEVAELADLAESTEAVSVLAVRIREVRNRLEAAHRIRANDRDRAVADLGRARAIRDQLGELQVLLDQACAECAPLLEASLDATALASLAAGGGANLKKMRLRSYVLAARLEQVAAAATSRLRQMSSGRYGFVHSDDLRGGNRRSGLSVDILDSHTGTQRPTKTLSGGESFMASLALALGLADVVTAESGGIELDTLFVDEGFGSLDPDSLDAVMTVLDELRQGGRVVGIVSHVEELRTRIPMQLQIQTSSNGSTMDQSELPGDLGVGLLAG